jgi:hypothetical protein
MGKADKLYLKWKARTPKEAKIRDVKTVLDQFFQGSWEFGKGSHIVVRHEALKVSRSFQPFGEITIPVKSGQKVKGFYIKILIEAIEVLREAES